MATVDLPCKKCSKKFFRESENAIVQMLGSIERKEKHQKKK